MKIFMRKNRALLSLVSFMMLLFSACTMGQTKTEERAVDEQTNRDTIAIEMQRVLDGEFNAWYPLSIDTLKGGFFSDINYKWELDGRQDKMIVTQARHIWSTANAAMFYQKDNTLRNIAAHGAAFLKNKMWDLE